MYTLQTAFWSQEYKNQRIYYVDKFEPKDNLYQEHILVNKLNKDGDVEKWRERKSLIFEGEIRDFYQFSSSSFFPRAVKMEGTVFGRIGKRGRSITSPTGMKEVTGRNEAEDSRLHPGITSITSEFADDSNPASGHARGGGRSFIENGGRGQFKEKKKRKGKKKKERKGNSSDLRFLVRD